MTYSSNWISPTGGGGSGGDRRVRVRRRQDDTHARLRQVAGDQADRQRHEGHQPEIADRLHRQPADALEVIPVSRDAHDQGAEDDRHHDRLDHPQENGGQRLDDRREILAGKLMVDVPHHDTHGHADEDPVGEGQATQYAEHGMVGFGVEATG